MWPRICQRNQTVLLQGSAPAEIKGDIFEASEFAYQIGLIKKDTQWDYVNFCIRNTTYGLLKTKKDMESKDATA